MLDCSFALSPNPVKVSCWFLILSTKNARLFKSSINKKQVFMVHFLFRPGSKLTHLILAVFVALLEEKNRLVEQLTSHSNTLAIKLKETKESYDKLIENIRFVRWFVSLCVFLVTPFFSDTRQSSAPRPLNLLSTNKSFSSRCCLNPFLEWKLTTRAKSIPCNNNWMRKRSSAKTPSIKSSLCPDRMRACWKKPNCWLLITRKWPRKTRSLFMKLKNYKSPSTANPCWIFCCPRLLLLQLLIAIITIPLFLLRLPFRRRRRAAIVHDHRILLLEVEARAKRDGHEKRTCVLMKRTQ